MARTTGVLMIDLSTRVSRLDTGTDRPRLAKTGPGNRFGNATEFMEDKRNLTGGDLIWVEGTGGSIIVITDAGLVSEPAITTAAGTAAKGDAVPAGAGGAFNLSPDEPSGGREVGAVASRMSASGKQGAAGKARGGKASGAKRSGAKKGGTKKAAAKKSAKKSAVRRGVAKKAVSRKTGRGAKGK